MQYSHKILEKIGLSKSEIQVYLAGLKLGPSLANTLSKETKLSRPLIYHILELLEAKVLESKLGHKHGRRFIIKPPSRLKNIAQDTLLVKNTEILALVPTENTFSLFDDSFMYYWRNEQEKKQIKSR